MAAGEVLLNGAQIGISGNSGQDLPNLLDANGMTFYSTSPSNSAWAGMDAGANCVLTRVRATPLGGSEDSSIGAIIQSSSSSTFAGLQYIQGTFTFLNGNQTTITGNFANAQNAGDTIVVIVLPDVASPTLTVTDTKGNNYVFVQGPVATSPGEYQYVAKNIAAATAGANTVTVTITGGGPMSYPLMYVAQLSGIDINTPVDVFGANNGSGTVVSVSLTTTSNNDLVCLWIGATAPVAGQGGLVTNGGTSTSVFMSVVVPLAGAHTFTATCGNGAWNVVAIALKGTTLAPTNLFSITSRMTTGTLLNEFLIPASSPARYFRWSCPSLSYGAIADLDFIAQYSTGVTGRVVTPVITPVSGLYDQPIVVQINSITTDASFFYTIDGSTPTTGSTHYTAPFVINASCNLQVIGTSPALSNSRIASYQYTIASAFISTNREYDDRNYPIIAATPNIFRDPVSGWWYRYVTNVDCPGVLTFGDLGMNIYKSADARNWKFVRNDIGPPPGQAVNYTTYIGQFSILYNAKNNNYVIWGSDQSGDHVYTCSSPEGPFVLFATYATLDGQSNSNGDITLFLDTDGVTAYIVHTGNSNSVVTFSRLNSDYTNVDGVHNATYNAISTWGSNREGHCVFYRKGTYFWISSTTSNWAPNMNMYATASTPIGPWSALVNPFVQQPGGGNGSPDYTISYDSQSSHKGLYIPGRSDVNGDMFVHLADRYDTGLGGGAITSTTANFQAYRTLYIPITFPTLTSMLITWNDNWSLDTSFPTVSGAPSAPSSLSISGVTALWVNNESKPHALYLDYATNSAFTQNVRSEIIGVGPGSSQPSSYAPIIPPVASPSTFYRMRAVNAAGTTSSSAFAFVIAPPVVTAFLGMMNTATRFVQQFIGEYVTISGVNYYCTQAENVSADFQFESGGALQWTHGAVIVSKLDLANEPVRGSPVTFRSLLYRVTEVFDLVVNWEIHFIQKSD